MKNTRAVRISSVFLSIFIVIGILSTNRVDVRAAVDTVTGLAYTVTDGEAEITDFAAPAGFDGSLIIPATLGGASVTSIGEYAFNDSENLTSITIPGSVTDIGLYSFCYCPNLTSLIVDTANTVYKSMNGVLYSKDGTILFCCPEGKSGSITIPNGVRILDFYSFRFCTNLTSITIPSSVISIDEYVFLRCTGLTGITIPNSVTSIGASAFYGCSSLESITIPSSVTKIESATFYLCTSLTGITIPSSVSSIGEYAFSSCTSLSDAYFFGNAPTMGNNVFNNCATGFSAHYLNTTTGYSNPWHGYPTEPFACGITYQTHIQDVGWQDYVSNGAVSGTSGQSKRLEAIRINLEKTGIGGSVVYRTHVQDYGWRDLVANNTMSGTSGQSKRLEAIEIYLIGEAEKVFDVYYHVHVQDTGWMDWAKNGASSGTAGYSYRLEAIEIRLVPKGNPAPGSTAQPFIDLYEVATVRYTTHVQDIGWQPSVRNGAISGTIGRSKRLEAIQIKLENMPGGIEYSTHVQDYGWMDWVADYAISGTSGQSKRLEAIKIRLTGEAALMFDVYYCVHAQNTGWLDWAKNGESAGTAGFGYRLEAIKVVLVPKGGPAPGATARAFVQG